MFLSKGPPDFCGHFRYPGINMWNDGSRIPGERRWSRVAKALHGDSTRAFFSIPECLGDKKKAPDAFWGPFWADGRILSLVNWSQLIRFFFGGTGKWKKKNATNLSIFEFEGTWFSITFFSLTGLLSRFVLADFYPQKTARMWPGGVRHDWEKAQGIGT